MVDHEGGKVQRFGPPFAALPAAREIGSTNDPETAEIVGTVTGRELKSVFVDLNLAPVADVDTNPKNPVIASRSFGPTPSTVSRMVKSYVRGIQSQNVGACAKHFPGHGDTSIDSHLDLPVLNFQMKRLSRVEIVPFKHAIESGIAAIMIGHIVCNNLRSSKDKSEGKTEPCSLRSGAIDFLRKELKFEGLVVSDDMEMGAISKHFSPEEAAKKAITSGTDLVLFCHSEKNQVRALEHIIASVSRGEISADIITEANRRLDQFCSRFVYIPPKQLSESDKKKLLDEYTVVGCKEHQDMLANVQYLAALASGK